VGWLWLGTTSAVRPCTQHDSLCGEIRSCQEPSSLRATAVMPFTQASGNTVGPGPVSGALWASPLCPPLEPTTVDTLANSVCSKQPNGPSPLLSKRLHDSPVNVEASTGCGIYPCAGLEAQSWAMWCIVFPCVWPGLQGVPGSMLPRGCVLPSGVFSQAKGLHASSDCDGTTFRVKDTLAPEVKFLDRHEINSGEGALQGCVRRSRTRVWGAKMIRHRRSPAL